MAEEDCPFEVVCTNGSDEVLVYANNLLIGRAAFETHLTPRRRPDLMTNVDGKHCPASSDCCPQSIGFTVRFRRNAHSHSRAALKRFNSSGTTTIASRQRQAARSTI
jgi:hypothetical protein